MPIKTAIHGLLATAFCLMLSAPGLAQSTNYSSIETVAGVTAQVNYHAMATKDCTPAPRPSIRVLEAPKYGTMTLRPATVIANIAYCHNVKADAQVVYYTGRVGYSGADHIRYEITNPNGEIDTFDVAITVKHGAQTPPAPGEHI
jgi:hypothetical protein